MGGVGGVSVTRKAGEAGLSEDHARHRPLLFSIAYGMTGSVSDAEDIVQEAFARMAQALRGGTTVTEPKAYLAAAATRLALNHLRSARLHRESYRGTWLPEPVFTGPGPEERAEMADSLSLAFLVVLESLSPAERAVFLLHEVFGYEHKEIAEITGTSVANCRQVLARARRGRTRAHRAAASGMGARGAARRDVPGQRRHRGGQHRGTVDPRRAVRQRR
jgi:RNA polymerase sigma factor (sigma-70 family)